MNRLALTSTLVVSAAIASAVGVHEVDGQTPSAQVSPNPTRTAAMRHHFAEVAVVHDALVRGDLAAARAPAQRLARMPAPPGLPDGSAPSVAMLQRAGRNAAAATTLAQAAAAAGSMLAQCGSCHRAVGARVNAATDSGPGVGGLVGHMLEHQRAMDDLLQGLFVPSAAQWRLGAERLSEATLLDPRKLPRDPKWTESLRLAEKRTHAIAREAAGDTIADQRVDHYARLVTTCAECHGLHSRIWGPTGRR